jgi:hypothetical protein
MASDPETRALDARGASFSSLRLMTQRQDGGDQLVRRVGPDFDYFVD